MYKAVLFDMDGTILHMDQDMFLKNYMKAIFKNMLASGGELDTVKKAFYLGVEAMLKNDGSRSNYDAFWDNFMSVAVGDRERYIEICDEFYRGEYDSLKATTWVNPYAREAIELVRGRGAATVLATNPTFPRYAQIKRLAWGGLDERCFDIITDYESDRFGKPNPLYYLSICERLGVEPKDCLMVGNDAVDDMKGASEAGLDCYLVTDCLIESEKYVWQGKRGSFAELLEYLKSV